MPFRSSGKSILESKNLTTLDTVCWTPVIRVKRTNGQNKLTEKTEKTNGWTKRTDGRNEQNKLTEKTDNTDKTDITD